MKSKFDDIVLDLRDANALINNPLSSACLLHHSEPFMTVCKVRRHNLLRVESLLDWFITRNFVIFIARHWVFTRSDRRTDWSVRLVCPTGRSDDRIV